MRHRAQAVDPVFRGLRRAPSAVVCNPLRMEKRRLPGSSMGVWSTPSESTSLIEELSSPAAHHLPSTAIFLSLSVPAGQHRIQILACDWARLEDQRRHLTARIRLERRSQQPIRSVQTYPVRSHVGQSPVTTLWSLSHAAELRPPGKRAMAASPPSPLL